ACTAIFTILNFLVPIATICIGAIFVNDCPRQHMIPIYLIVSGCGILIRTFLGVVGLCIASKYENPEEVPPQTLTIKILDFLHATFIFCWFIAGNVWIFSIHKDHQESDPSQDSFCAAVVYKYAFWLTIVAYIGLILAIVLCLVGCLFFGVVICRAGDD
ncbi:hypothetical protein CAPTEDRAFT_95874, partial [Capitella teleta]